jgi:hypothetical protein
MAPPKLQGGRQYVFRGDGSVGLPLGLDAATPATSTP